MKHLPLILLALLSGCGNKAEVPIEATGVHVGDQERNPTTAGRDVWNINFGDAAGKAGYTIPLLIAAWYFSQRKVVKALDTTIEAIETAAPKDETKAIRRAIQKHANCYIDKRVACLHKKHGWN